MLTSTVGIVPVSQWPKKIFSKVWKKEENTRKIKTRQNCTLMFGLFFESTKGTEWLMY